MRKIPEFLKVLEEKDPEFIQHLVANLNNDLKDGALPSKIKLLIAMALDAAHGDNGGVKQLSQQAYDAGATSEEMVETVEVVANTCGMQGLYHALKGLEAIEKKSK